MDDAGGILATGEETLLSELSAFYQYCYEFGMIISEKIKQRFLWLIVR